MQSAKRSRRDILKTFGLGTVFSAAGGVAWTGMMLAEVTTRGAQVVNRLRLRLADFPALAKTNGSIRIGSSSVTGDFPDGLYYPIIITRGVGTVFYAVDSQCTHAACVVNAYNSRTGVIECPCHGSTFDKTGKRLSGEANTSLVAFATSYDAGSGVLTVDAGFDPDQNLSIESYELLRTGARRIALQWTAFPSVRYEIRFRTSLNAPSSPAAFALTQDGPAVETLFEGLGDIAQVWVDRPAAAGFFQIAFNYSEV